MEITARRVPAIEATGLFDWIVEVVTLAIVLAGGFVCGNLR